MLNCIARIDLQIIPGLFFSRGIAILLFTKEKTITINGIRNHSNNFLMKANRLLSIIVLILGIQYSHCSTNKGKGRDYIVIRQNYFDTAYFKLPLRDSFKANKEFWPEIPAVIPFNNDTRFMLIESVGQFSDSTEAVLYDYNSRQYFLCRSKGTGSTIKVVEDTLADLLKGYRPVVHSSEVVLKKTAAGFRPVRILMDGGSYVINDVNVVDNRLLNNAYHVFTLRLKND
jgi:hypothetical protein